VPERRQHTRLLKDIDFYCYVDGERFDSASVDISAGGAFLATEDDLRMDASVLIFPKAEKGKEQPAMLVGRVVRRQMGASPGLGVQWRGCICREGVPGIYQFLERYLELKHTLLPEPPHEVVGAPVVAFDFPNVRFYVPAVADLPDPASLTASDAPEAAGLDELGAPVAEALVQSPTYSRSGESGAVTTILGRQRGRVPVQIPVQFLVDDRKYDGVVTALGITTMFLNTDERIRPGSGRVVLPFPIPVESQPLMVRMHCAIMRIEDATQTRSDGVDLSIQHIEERKSPGLFQRYVKYLFYRMHTREDQFETTRP